MMNQCPRTIASLFVSVSCISGSWAGTGYSVGDTFPGFSAQDSYGNSFQFSQLSGRYVLIDFCASWCAPCQLMAPDAIRVSDAMNNAGVPFTYLHALLQNSVGLPSTLVVAQQWASVFDVISPVRVLHANGVANSEMEQAFLNLGGAAFPTLVVIAPDGEILSIVPGLATAPDLVAALAGHAGVPVPPVPGEPIMPSLSMAEGLLSATITVSMGAGTASAPADGGPTQLYFNLAGGTLPIDDAYANVQSTVSLSQESWTFELGSPATALPLDQPILAILDDLNWADGCQSLTLFQAQMFGEDINGASVTFANPNIAVSMVGDSLQFGPVTLQDAGPSLPDVRTIGMALDDLFLHSPDLEVMELADHVVVNAGQTAQFSSSVTGGNGTLTYQWDREGVDLNDGGQVSGANTNTLMISNAGPSEEGWYGLRVTDGCRTVHSGYRRLGLTPVFCPADANGSGVTDIDDLLLVINNWGASGGPADVNGSGSVDIDDLLAVINAWGPCP